MQSVVSGRGTQAWKEKISTSRAKYRFSNDELLAIYERSPEQLPRATLYRLLKKHGIPLHRPTKAYQIREISPIECAWLAAAIDSEGCLRISSARKDGKSYSYKDLQVANTNELFIQNVARVTGAPTITKRKPRPGWKPVYVWQLRRHESVLNILRQVIPYLIIKKGTAEAMLQ